MQDQSYSRDLEFTSRLSAMALSVISLSRLSHLLLNNTWNELKSTKQSRTRKKEEGIRKTT